MIAHLREDLLVQLEPGREALGVRVLQAKVPDLAKTDCLDYLRRD